MIIQFPNVKNTSYSDSDQESKLPTAFAHFIPICMINDISFIDDKTWRQSLFLYLQYLNLIDKDWNLLLMIWMFC